MKIAPGLATALCLVACHPAGHDGGVAAHGSASAEASATSATSATSAATAATSAAAPAIPASSGTAPEGALPPVARSCTRDAECAVARVETSGEYVCCPACNTTPGTRAWHARLQKYCAARPPGVCHPLACPQGPTRAVCRAGVCEATASDDDGRPIYVPVVQRCLPAMICDAWAGCAEVVGNGQDGFFTRGASRVAPGTLAAVETNVCTTAGAGRCEAARLLPSDVVCPPHSIPPPIAPPPFACALDDGRCVEHPR